MGQKFYLGEVDQECENPQSPSPQLTHSTVILELRWGKLRWQEATAPNQNTAFKAGDHFDRSKPLSTPTTTLQWLRDSAQGTGRL